MNAHAFHCDKMNEQGRAGAARWACPVHTPVRNDADRDAVGGSILPLLTDPDTGRGFAAPVLFPQFSLRMVPPVRCAGRSASGFLPRLVGRHHSRLSAFAAARHIRFQIGHEACKHFADLLKNHRSLSVAVVSVTQRTEREIPDEQESIVSGATSV